MIENGRAAPLVSLSPSWQNIGIVLATRFIVDGAAA
jgi:hypothetical protein